MKTKKELNVKNMLETYLFYELNPEVWKDFYSMALYDFLTSKEWSKFSKIAAGWYISDNGEFVRDSLDNDKIVFVRDPETRNFKKA